MPNRERADQYSAYLFDADGTLMDSTAMICHTYIRTLRKYAGIEMTAKEFIPEIGLPLDKTLRKHLGPVGDERLREVIRDFRDYQFTIADKYLKLFPDVKEALKKMLKAGKRMAVVSARAYESLSVYFRNLDVYDFFSVYITPESTEKHKPEPEPVLKALELLKTDVRDALFVGDAKYDAGCAWNAGMDFCFVNWSHNPVEEFGRNPDFCIDSLLELT